MNTVYCFTGHRKLLANKIEYIIKRLSDEIENLIRQGVTDFISGGALGFDQIAASLVVAKKEMGADHSLRPAKRSVWDKYGRSVKWVLRCQDSNLRGRSYKPAQGIGSSFQGVLGGKAAY